MEIVKTTSTPRGQTIDWIPIKSQHPQGRIATPPPKLVRPTRNRDHKRKERIAIPELEIKGVERGPLGSGPRASQKARGFGIYPFAQGLPIQDTRPPHHAYG